LKVEIDRIIEEFMIRFPVFRLPTYWQINRPVRLIWNLIMMCFS